MAKNTILRNTFGACHQEASETKDAERRVACAKVAIEHRKEGERVVEEVVEVTTRNQVVGAGNNKRNNK